jgi:8-amino-7-oxononanoate synthase
VAKPGLRSDLGRNAARLYDGLAQAGFSLGPTVSPIVSIRFDSPEIAVVFWNKLLALGIYANLALPPATPGRQSLLRSSVSAAHTSAEIELAIKAIIAVGIELGIVQHARESFLPAAQ